MGKGLQLPFLHTSQDGGDTVGGSESKSGLPVSLLSSGRLRTSRHHHRRQVTAVHFKSLMYLSLKGAISMNVTVPER